MKALWIEIKRFIKDQILFILIGAAIIAAVYTIGVTYLDLGNPDLEDESEIGVSVGENEEEAAYFHFFIENQDGSPFTNTAILEQYFLMDSTLENASQETNVDIYEMFQQELASEFSRTENDRGVLGVVRNPHSMRYSLISNTGDEQDNLRIASYYHDLIVNDEVPFLTDKNVYIFVEPTLRDSNDEFEDDAPIEISSGSILRNALLGSLFGIIVMLAISVLRSLFSKKLKYSFSYNWEEEDVFFLSDKNLENNDELSQMVTLPAKKEKIVLSEKELSETIKDKLSANERVSFISKNDTNEKIILVEEHSFSNIDVFKDITDIFIVIEANRTSRSWYKKQRRLLSAFNLPVHVIQFNE